MKAIFSNFIYVLKRFKTSSILNLLGLSAAIFVFIVVAIQVHYDLTFNTSFDNHENVYQLTKLQKTAEDEVYLNNIDVEEVNIITNTFPEITQLCTISLGDYKKDVIKMGNNGERKEYKEINAIVNDGFFQIFQPKVVEGNLEEASTIYGNTMVSEKTAQRIFGDKSPIDEVIQLTTFKIIKKIDPKTGGVVGLNVADTIVPFTIKAVYEDFTDNSSVSNGFISYRPMEEYVNYDQIFFTINKQTKDALRAKMNEKSIIDQFTFRVFKGNADQNENVERTNSLELIPIKNIHINYPELSSKGQDKKEVYFLITIGLFALAIAYINFINFATAMAPARIRGINIRMIIGADKKMIRFILAGEALLFTLCALLIALFAIYIFKDSAIAQMFTAKMDMLQNMSLITCISIILLILSFIIGIYPAYYITSFNAVAALNSTNSGDVRSSSLRNILIVIQLLAAIVFITVALFIKFQHSYMVHYSLGFERENILILDTKYGQRLNTPTKTFIDEVMRSPLIKESTVSNLVMGRADVNTSMTSFDKEVFLFNTLLVADNILEFFNIPLIEGQNFTKYKSGEKIDIIMNEQFIKRHKIEGGLDGALESSFGKKMEKLNIIGVAKDFNYASLMKGDIGSLILMNRDINNLSFIYFKPSEGNAVEARKYIEETWKKFGKEDIQLEFLDQDLERLYKSQENLALIVSIVSLIIIIIAVMGVYGLITFNTKYRTKEIAIRRVNGAELSNVVYLLNRGLVFQFLIAFAIAIPIIYYIMDMWLKQFPYRINISWTIFALGGLIILLITLITVSYQSYKAAVKNPVDSLKSE